jgi:hypothetical protein
VSSQNILKNASKKWARRERIETFQSTILNASKKRERRKMDGNPSNPP